MTPYYERDGVVVLHGDCRSILPQLEPVDCVITDPPYSEHVHAKQWVAHALTDRGQRRHSVHEGVTFAAITPTLRADLVQEISAKCRRWFIAFSDVESAHEWSAVLRSYGWDYVRTCFWEKPDATPQFSGDRPASAVEAICLAHSKGEKYWNGGGRRNVFRHQVTNGRGPESHPTQKPLALMRELVELFTDPGETILDPFCGSGATLVAAYQLGRKAIGIELEEKWCEVTAKRLEAQTPPLPLIHAPPPRQMGLEL